MTTRWDKTAVIAIHPEGIRSLAQRRQLLGRECARRGPVGLVVDQVILDLRRVRPGLEHRDVNDVEETWFLPILKAPLLE